MSSVVTTMKRGYDETIFMLTMDETLDVSTNNILMIQDDSHTEHYSMEQLIVSCKCLIVMKTLSRRCVDIKSLPHRLWRRRVTIKHFLGHAV